MSKNLHTHTEPLQPTSAARRLPKQPRPINHLLPPSTHHGHIPPPRLLRPTRPLRGTAITTLPMERAPLSPPSTTSPPHEPTIRSPNLYLCAPAPLHLPIIQRMIPQPRQMPDLPIPPRSVGAHVPIPQAARVQTALHSAQPPLQPRKPDMAARWPQSRGRRGGAGRKTGSRGRGGEEREAGLRGECVQAEGGEGAGRGSGVE